MQNSGCLSLAKNYLEIRDKERKMKKINKNVAIVFGVFLLTLLGCLSFVSAASVITISAPTAASRISGAYTANVTNTTNFDAMVNCSFYIKSTSLTANTTWSLLNGTATNESLTRVAGVLPTTVVQDGTDYTLNATCRNSSNALADATVAVIVDNTIPQAPTLSPTTNTEITSSTTQTFTGTVTDANTTACTYVIGRGGTDTSSQDTTSASGTYSGASCTFTKTFDGTEDNGNWYWYITASDGTNTTASTTNIVQVSLAPAGGVDLSGLQTTTEAPTIVETLQQNQGTVGIILVAAIAVIVVIVVLVRRANS